MADENRKFTEEIEKQVADRVITNEFNTAKRNRKNDIDDFESYISLLDSVREPKQYDWMSDIRIPEFISHVLTQASIDANQYFQNRDYVEAYLEDEGDEALANSGASKELINRTLNQRHLHHYSKYMRGKVTNNLVGQVYAKCWWEQKTKEEVVGTEIVPEILDIDIDGNPLEDLDQQIPAFQEVEQDVVKEIPLVDRFNYDILDSRNVFTDNKYTYTLQDKDYVFIRSEQSKSDLLAKQEEMNYFNLELLDDLNVSGETETSKETYNKDKKEEKVALPISEPLDILERFGRFWSIVEARDEEGNPTEIKPGIDELGQIKDGAVLIETIITHATKNHKSVLIRYQPTPYIDAKGNPYKPIIRGLCYIHPTNDGGIGDGKHIKELQLALDDTFNVSNDRVMLATLPTMVVDRAEAEDNPEIYIEPGHKIPLERPKENFKELGISDNIQGAMQQAAFIKNQMQQVDAIFPNTMGDVPGLASTTATAVAGAETRSNMRANYKSLTFENTFLSELYWMIMQMTWTFAKPDTGVVLMGDKVGDFDPAKDYFFKPVSSSIEPEYSKQNKIKLWSTIFAQMANIPHPDIIKPLNYVMSQMFALMGDEFVNFSDKFLDPNKPLQDQAAQGEQQGFPTSNQAGVPQGVLEQSARENV